MTSELPLRSLTTYRRLIVAKAFASTRTEIVRDLIVAAITAGLLSILLYLGTIGRTFAVGEIKSVLVFVLGIGIFVLVSFLLNLFRSAHSVWLEDQERLQSQAEIVANLEAQMQPEIVLVPDPNHRTTPDRSWMTVTMLVYNLGVDAAINCYVKAANIFPIAVGQQPDLVPAYGTVLLWIDRNNSQVCTIAGRSSENLGLAVRLLAQPDTWHLHTDAATQIFPLKEGIWGLTLEAGAENVMARRTDWRITYISPTNFTVEFVPPPQLPPPSQRQSATSS